MVLRHLVENQYGGKSNTNNKPINCHIQTYSILLQAVDMDEVLAETSLPFDTYCAA